MHPPLPAEDEVAVVVAAAAAVVVDDDSATDIVQQHVPNHNLQIQPYAQ
jgi:hypothetical protein